MHIYNTVQEMKLKWGGIEYLLMKGFNELPNDVADAYFLTGNLNMPEEEIENAIRTVTYRWKAIGYPKVDEKFWQNTNQDNALFFIASTREELENILSMFTYKGKPKDGSNSK